MFNIHLLKRNLTSAQVAEIEENRYSYKHGVEYVQRLPVYTVAVCPFCAKENIEHLQTYSSQDWVLTSGEPKHSIGGNKGVSFHCEHFALGQTFLNQLDPRQQKTVFRPRPPYVYGLLLEENVAKAVVHTLPVCDYVAGEYTPLHTLYMLTYFSENGKSTYEYIGHLAIERARATEANTWLILPRIDKNEDHWWNLSHWVERSLLYWIDASEAKDAGDGKSRLRTKMVDEFPYKHLHKA